MGVTTRAVVIFVLSCTLAASAAGIVRTSALDESTVRLPGVAGFLHPEARFPADAGLDGTPAKEWATQRFSKLSNKGFDLISSVDGVRRLVLSLLSGDEQLMVCLRSCCFQTLVSCLCRGN